MAVRASNFALRDLQLQPSKADAATCKLGHVRGLGTDVVKLQRHEPRLAAVDTLRLRQQLAQADHIPTLARGEMNTLVEARRIESPGSARCSCPNAVAVRAYDDAFLELPTERSHRGSGVDQIGDVSALLLHVVKLEDIGIDLAAIGAGLGL